MENFNTMAISAYFYFISIYLFIVYSFSLITHRKDVIIKSCNSIPIISAKLFYRNCFLAALRDRDAAATTYINRNLSLRQIASHAINIKQQKQKHKRKMIDVQHTIVYTRIILLASERQLDSRI